MGMYRPAPRPWPPPPPPNPLEPPPAAASAVGARIVASTTTSSAMSTIRRWRLIPVPIRCLLDAAGPVAGMCWSPAAGRAAVALEAGVRPRAGAMRSRLAPQGSRTADTRVTPLGDHQVDLGGWS